MKTDKLGIIVQARMGSARLPGKVLMKLGNSTVIESVIDRLMIIPNVKIIVATTSLTEDDQIVNLLGNYDDIGIYRGSSENVLSRYIEAAKKFGLKSVIRVTADCPLIDPYLIQEGLDYFMNGNYDLVTNGGPYLEKRYFPRGFDFEIFDIDYLESLTSRDDTVYEKEHVTPLLYKHSNKIKFIDSPTNNSDLRITLDTLQDYELINIVFDNLYKGKNNFSASEIIDFLRANPDYISINRNVIQKHT
jgi:spore coat polysaccharide biosynthesis protein SpsF